MKRLIAINERYLLITIQVVVGLLCIVPLIASSNFYFPFVVPRNFIFRTLVEVLLFVYLLLVSQNRNYLPRKSPVWIVLLLFAGFMTLSSIVAGEFGFSLLSTYERMEGLTTLYHLLIFFFIIYGSMRERIQWERMLQMSTFIALTVSFVGLSQYAGVNLLLESSGGERISSTLGNATYLSAYLLIHLFFSLYFLLKPKEQGDLWFYKWGFIGLDIVLVVLQFMYGSSQDSTEGILQQIMSSALLSVPFALLHILAFWHFWLKRGSVAVVRYASYAFYGLSAVLFLFLTVSTQTRGALVGLGLAALFACVLLIFRRNEQPLIRWIAVALVAIGIGGAVVIFANTESLFVRSQPLLTKITSISLTDGTTQSRLATWKAAVQSFYDKPLLGWGVENFHVAFNEHFPTVIYHDEGNPLWFDRPHNLLLQYLVEGGAPALVLYLIFVGMLIVYVIRRQPQRRMGVLFSAFLVGYVGQNLFVFDSINSYIPFYIAIGFILFLISHGSESSTPSPLMHGSKSSMRLAYSGIGAALVVFALFSFVYDVWAINMNTSFVDAYRLQREAPGGFNPTLTDKVFAAIDGGPSLGRAELLGVYSEYAVDLLQDTKVPRDSITPMVRGVVDRFERLVATNDNDARLDMFLMNLYLNADGIDPEYLDRLLKLGQTTLVLSPTRPQIYYLMGRAHMKKRMFDEGIEDFKRGVALAPEVYDARWNLFAAYATVRETDKARIELQKLKTLKKYEQEDYIKAATIYAATKNYPEAEEVLKDGVTAFPDTIDLIAALAQIYAVQGKNKEARDTIKRVADLNPSMQAQVDEFYRRINSGEFLPKP